jgi:hypothetical protein
VALTGLQGWFVSRRAETINKGFEGGQALISEAVKNWPTAPDGRGSETELVDFTEVTEPRA